jgi:glycosyltransferase involved in cell wall biosynthesis
MIVIVHDQQVVTQLLIDNNDVSIYNGEQVTKVVPILVKQYPNQLLIWCYKSVVKNVAWDSISSLFDLDRKMLSYLPESNFFSDSIGYVEDSIFIKVNKKNSYPTWQMSSYVGGASISFLSQIDTCFWNSKRFDYALNSIAKYYQPEGLFPYSEPKLLINPEEPVSSEFSKANLRTLFKFIKEHYKTVWIFLLLLNLFINERKIAIVSLIRVFFVKKKTSTRKIVFHDFDVSTIDLSLSTIDVIIPTIGRKKYLYDVLKDLSVQTLLPKNVIIIEQNPLEGSQSELDFISNEKWPFEIKHEFIHQSGACNARNRALSHVVSDWIFFADDDIRFENQLIASTLQKAHELKSKAINLSCLQANEKRTMDSIIQWMSFGSGCSIVKTEVVEGLSFEMAYEFGFGEDVDFGMQMRNKGCDIIYVPDPTILHLKAPIGGFRTKPVLDWHSEPLAPKPSPTILLFFFLHKTKQQLFGYRTTLFFKFYKFQSVKNPFLYYKLFKKQWSVSVKWATILKNRHEL